MDSKSNHKACAFIVLGMHRSGTSVLTGILRLLGIDLGSNFLPANKDNLTGFWEHQEICQIHENLLSDLGSGWDDLRCLPAKWWESDLIVHHRLELRKLIERDFAKSSMWGIKDPRMCRLLKFWQPLIDNAQVVPKYIIIVRNPLEVAASLATRDGFNKSKSCLLWLKHLIEAERYTRNNARVILTYADLLTNWESELQRLQETLKIKWPIPITNAAPAIAQFVDKNLRHHHLAAAKLFNDANINKWLKDAYGTITRSVTDQASLVRTLTRIDQELREAEKLFSPLMQKYQHAQEQI